MIYEEYYKKYRKFRSVKQEINRLENKKVSLMGMADIKAIAPKDSDGTSSDKDRIGVYLGELEEVEQNLIKQKHILKEIKNQLEEKEAELRDSHEVLDKVYLYKYIEKMKYYQIAIKTGYEKSSIYNFINQISKRLEIIITLEKNGKI